MFAPGRQFALIPHGVALADLALLDMAQDRRQLRTGLALNRERNQVTPQARTACSGAARPARVKMT